MNSYCESISSLLLTHAVSCFPFSSLSRWYGMILCFGQWLISNHVQSYAYVYSAIVCTATTVPCNRIINMFLCTTVQCTIQPDRSAFQHTEFIWIAPNKFKQRNMLHIAEPLQLEYSVVHTFQGNEHTATLLSNWYIALIVTTTFTKRQQ